VLTSCCTVLHGDGRRVQNWPPNTTRAVRRIRRLPSRRYRASYTGSGLGLHKAASTFETLMDADCE